MDIKNFLQFLDTLSLRHDPYENAHSANTATLVMELAKFTNYPAIKMDALKIAARVHDIGKLLIPETILNKQGKLTVEEIEMIHRHVHIGYDAIQAFTDFDPLIANVVLEHHEHYDGTGYPGGISREAISIEARMVSICDTFDALTSSRAYRKALAVEDAVRIMEDDTGAFDPVLLDIFVRIITK